VKKEDELGSFHRPGALPKGMAVRSADLMSTLSLAHEELRSMERVVLTGRG
jgi:hypothetical protein